jgi:formate hydrogenlyase transcriptional activator
MTLGPAADQLRGFSNSVPTLVWSAAADGAAESFNQRWLDYTGLTASEGLGGGWKAAIHPDDLPRLLHTFERARESCQPFEFDARLRRFDGTFRRFLMRGEPVRDERGRVVTWHGRNIDLEDRARAEDALRLSAEGLRLIVDTIPGLVAITAADGELELVNHRVLEYFGRAFEELKNWATSDAVHPDDLPGVVAAWNRSMTTGTPFDFEHRLRRRDGTYRWFQWRAHPLRDAEGRVVRWYNLITDIDDLKLAQMKLRQDEAELRQIADASPQAIIVFSADGRLLYANRFSLDYSGLSLDDFRADGWRERIYHPDDLQNFMDERRQGLALGAPFESELRMLRADGEYRWSRIRYNPLLDDDGNVTRWYATRTDIDDHKRAEEQLRNENQALRDEISSASMFEEIVGLSKAITTVVQQVARVAPTDSTVLISGETGTGKELVARAIHKRSARSARPFVAVNCAAIPASLIASELFGHERGAFTGAVQRRQGKFELADGGTVFLDEVGELPSETQVALLRVLQEREIERVGGCRPIRVDVRVVAATNRDLPGAIVERAFRSDLFYRLNVFPIEMPPLRERPTDIPLLLEYFVHRFSKRAGKKITGISNNTLDLLQSYPWPGNIRELQNVIERAVIVSDGERLTVDSRWLAGRSTHSPASQQPLGDALVARERAMIEAALAQTKGRVSGPSGAAARLGIPRSTLESKIRSLGLNKYRFKTH